MNSIVTAKALSGAYGLAGRRWSYDYRALPRFGEANVAAYIERQRPKFVAKAKTWSPDANSEWICRHYLAAKMIMMATLQLNSLEYARTHNLRLVSPYLGYYAVFSLLRAVIFTLPERAWDDGNLITLSHQKVDNLSFDNLRYLDKDWAVSAAAKFRRLRHERELISYWHPSSGDSEFQPIDDVLDLSTCLAEIAQINSEMMAAAIDKHSTKKNWQFLDSYIDRLSKVELVGEVHVDRDDIHRLGYLSRKWARPTTLQHTITEGHSEDFFGAWYAENDEDMDLFDPDLSTQLIFDFF